MEDEGVVSQHMIAEGPMACRLTDVRLALTILAGGHIRDPRNVPMPLEPPMLPTIRVPRVPETPAGQTDPRMALVKLRIQPCRRPKNQPVKSKKTVPFWRSFT